MAAQTGTREASIHRVASLRLEGDGHASGLKGFALERLSSRELRRLALGRFKSGISNCYSKQWLEHRLNDGSQRASGLECAGAALVSMSGLRSTVSMSISAKRPWPAADAAASLRFVSPPPLGARHPPRHALAAKDRRRCASVRALAEDIRALTKALPIAW